jgi:hypothetical protein
VYSYKLGILQIVLSIDTMAVQNEKKVKFEKRTETARKLQGHPPTKQILSISENRDANQHLREQTIIQIKFTFFTFSGNHFE